MKREDRQTENDREHARNVFNGFDKMTTLRMVCCIFLNNFLRTKVKFYSQKVRAPWNLFISIFGGKILFITVW